MNRHDAPTVFLRLRPANFHRIAGGGHNGNISAYFIGSQAHVRRDQSAIQFSAEHSETHLWSPLFLGRWRRHLGVNQFDARQRAICGNVENGLHENLFQVRRLRPVGWGEIVQVSAVLVDALVCKICRLVLKWHRWSVFYVDLRERMASAALLRTYFWPSNFCAINS